jgi:hypothetical protein
MPVSSDISGTLGTVTWSEEQLYLKEFVHKHDLPAVVRIVKGQYCNLGVSGLSNPSLQSTILITSVGRRKRILAQSIKFKDSRRVVPVGPKLAIPNTFEGFFELLSEDGRSVRCIESVSELSRRFPDAILVREAVRAFVSKSDDVDTIEDHSRLVEAGETLLLVGEVMGVKGRVRARFLRCFDKNGENVYMPFELKGKFCAIAKEDNISGVHTAENLTSKRLPIMTRMVHGLPPVGLKSSQSFLPEMRLFNTIDEDCLMAMTLSSSNAAVVPLPLTANIKIHYATNMPVLNTTKEFIRLRERCLELSGHLEDRILVHDITLAKDLRINGADLKQKINTKSTVIIQTGMPRRIYGHGYQPSDEYDEIEQIYDYVRGFAPLPKTARGWKYEPIIAKLASPLTTEESSSSTNQDSSDLTPPEPPPLETLPSRKHQPMDMSQVIYSPPPWGVASYGHIKQAPNNEIYEQIPVVKATEAKKRQRHSAEKSSSKQNGGGRQQQHHEIENLVPNSNNNGNQPPQQTSLTSNGTSQRFIKSANYRSMQNGGGGATNYRQRFFRTNRPSAPAGNGNNNKEMYGTFTGQVNHGPSMFQMRYKSMTNLAAQVNSSSMGGEYDTLDSSNSGGKTSGGSSSTRQPEKRSRKLSRPKSLTNLVWGSSKDRSASRQSLNADPDPMRRLEPGVFGNRRLSRDCSSSPAHHASVMANGKKLGSSKKIGTLYL